jgi:hypothetical protein
MSGGLAVAYHLINMIGDAIDFAGRIFDRFRRAICGLSSLVGRELRLSGGLFSMLSGPLSLGGRGFRLLGLLLVTASDDRDRENHDRQCEEKSAHPR